ncbi:CBS domain-containing protein [Desulfurispora thermophila]|uniref:CBS domain-containing protein n=1 Tax=Desulfurispora thermophila TaxID=265470 RepID=UPI0003795A1E|nr:CBS domain-containing protein [Desulfurispora thermophila]
MSNHSIMDCLTPLTHFLKVCEDDHITRAISLLKVSLHQPSAWQGERVLLVTDRQEKLTGLITFKCLMNLTGLVLMNHDPFFRAEYVSWYFINKALQKNSLITVREIMRPILSSCVKADSSLLEVAELFAQQKRNYLPVVNKVGNVIGILNIHNVFLKLYYSTHFTPEKVDRSEIHNKILLQKNFRF